MIKRPGPLVQMTLALVGLCGMLVILADLFFGVLPDRGAQEMRWRKNVSETLAVQVATLLQGEHHALLQRTFDGVVARAEGVTSLAIRRTNGDIVAQAGDHARHWQLKIGEDSTPEQVTVPLSAGGVRWGTFELTFGGRHANAVTEFFRQPLVMTLLFVFVVGSLAFGLYMRRALQHLDPAAVIPERVQGAFDAMAEGVVILDARARVLMTNKSFRELHQQARELGVGKPLSGLPWLGESLPADVEAHPWMRAITERSANSGITLEVGRGTPNARHLVIGCVPITDPGGTVRGCLATFNDVSELHRSNEALRDAVDALHLSSQEVQRQNIELERLATRDPLTGCLNRRALHDRVDSLLAEAQATNSPLCCVMLDIDHFKAVNDNHGHQIGDRAIQEVAKRLLECARSTDLVCRYGGEEFCIILPGMPLATASAFAENVRARIEKECGLGVREVQGLRITVSLGIDTLARGTSTILQLIDHADQALYLAKHAGRNRVCVYTPLHAGTAEASQIDPVSGCLTLAAFQTAFELTLREANARALTINGIKLAIDPYRALLADQGQDMADAAVREVARVLMDAVRPGDLVVRLDAEHLGVVSTGGTFNGATQLAQSVRERVEALGIASGADTLDNHRLTVSAGVDTLPASASGAAMLMDRADNALTRAKRRGRNRVHRFASEPTSTLESTEI